MARYEGMIAETVSIAGHNGDQIEAYLARPLGPGPFPGVLHLHHMPGYDWDSKSFAERFAAEGYAALVINIFSREAPGVTDATEASAIVREIGGIDDTQAIGDFQAAGQYLRDLPYTNGKLGVIGWCSGGRHAVLAACSFPVDAVVNCWGGKVVVDKPEDLGKVYTKVGVDMIPDLTGPMLGLFGEEDKSPTPAHVEVLRQALEKAGKTYEFHTYENTGHGFMSQSRPSYRVDATNKGWAEIMKWYGKYLH